MITSLISLFGAGCTQHQFFFLPTWYKYLIEAGKMQVVNGRCQLVESGPDKFAITDISLILLAVLDIALRLAGLVAVAFVVWGGVKLITSQGDPEGMKHARQTIFNALIGLVIALFATALVAFVGTRLG